MRVLIVGGGVGGLTLAKALLVKAEEERKDVKVVVLEKGTELATSGHGVTLFEGLGILHRLGLGSSLVKVSTVLTDQVVSADGRLLVETSSSNNKPTQFAPRGIRRPDLVHLLKESLPDDILKLDWQVVKVEEADDQVSVVNQRGEELKGDLLVGFDGIGGKVRAFVTTASTDEKSAKSMREFGQCCVLLGTANKLRETGGDANNIISSDGTLVHHFDRKTGSVGVFSGTSNGQFAWTIGYRCPKEPERNPDWKNNDKALKAAMEVVQQWSGSASAQFQTLLAGSSGCLQLGVYTQPKRELQAPWHRGRLVLGGDAAHAVLPLLGEGANLAMSDAVVLARQILQVQIPTKEELEAAFKRYEEERRGPSQSGVAMTKALRPVMLSQNWLVCQLRNGMMKHMIGANWSSSQLRAQDASLLLDKPIQDRNPHANLGSNVGMVLAHVAVIGGGIALSLYLLNRPRT
ncbi:heptyl-3-hydroxy-4(1H)-quinolone synthase [Seminavis robusta]|uniref:Heptyl-3-hydroxy-4(1H)-quinolone synthase n=1 Tax=Seminavis robusta TaxID=568900 RepID=A0A9N8EQK4_9STRA|nr:heptyl-3-hydroxy-4(1H)-quinolone synthase [Seminavis robusta]|eukprot:Sro1792_g297840.1 heptyl-3-hydroxy-4(1H)-quinolone synthase (462) ;mRNA; f:7352-8737